MRSIEKGKKKARFNSRKKFGPKSHMDFKGVLVDPEYLTSKQFDSYELIVKKMQSNWRNQIAIMVVALGLLFEPGEAEKFLDNFKFPEQSFRVFVAYTLPVSFIYFGFYLGRYIHARFSIETMVMKNLVPNLHEAVKVTDGLFVFDIPHRLMSLPLPITGKINV